MMHRSAPAALLLLAGCAGGSGFDGHSPQIAVSSGKPVAAIRDCIVARLARFGPPASSTDPGRLVLEFKADPDPVTIVINNLGEESRSIEAWKKGPRDPQLMRDARACI